MKQEIRFLYVTPESYKPAYVNGAHGGVSPRGEIVINFYHERPPLPESITHEITPEGSIGREVSQQPDDQRNTMVRAVEAGVILSYDNARNFYLWLGERLKEMESLERARSAFASEMEGGKPGAAH